MDGDHLSSGGTIFAGNGLVSEKCRILLDGLGEFGTIVVDAETNRILDINTTALALLGAKREEVIGREHHQFVSPAGQGYSSAVDPGKAVDPSEWVLCRSDGRSIPVLKSVLQIEVDGRKALLESIVDISARKKAEEDLRRSTFYDSLTGLANRALFVDRLDRCITRVKRQKNFLFSVLLLGLDRFKFLNESLGHEVGEKTLVVVAHRLQKTLRSVDTVAIQTNVTHTLARMGEDKFTILLEGIRSNGDAVRVAQRIQALFDQPLEVKGQEIFTSASFGIATYDGKRTSAEAMLQDADIALYRARKQGRGSYVVFDEVMHAQAVERMNLEFDLRRAVEREQFSLVFQPIVSLVSDRIIGVETLVRWQHPERGTILPIEFIPVAEEMGLIVPIGLFVLREACRQMNLWQEQFPSDPPLTVAVNLSSLQVRQPDLARKIKDILRETGLAPGSLHLEITESALLEHNRHTAGTLKKLKQQGVSLHLDDFGTGYSSLSYLHQFPIDVVKVDRTFIQKLDGDSGKLGLVGSIMAMAHNRGMGVIAEGIETVSQLECLKNMQCEMGQGFYLARPKKAKAIGQLLSKHLG
ncbi:MAG TPA: EAL domain-containing protein [Spirochaetia bacterium]|nr:EAL domain-containing protein [Spirochaetia bacterium]